MSVLNSINVGNRNLQLEFPFFEVEREIEYGGDDWIGPESGEYEYVPWRESRNLLGGVPWGQNTRVSQGDWRQPQVIISAPN